MDMWPVSKGFSETIIEKEASSTATSVMHDSNELFSPKDRDPIVVHETPTVKDIASNVLFCASPPFQDVYTPVDTRKDAQLVAVSPPTSPHSSGVVSTKTHSQNTLLDGTEESKKIMVWWQLFGKRKWSHTQLESHLGQQYHCIPYVSYLSNELQPKSHLLTSENARNTSHISNESRTDKSDAMTTPNFGSDTHDSNPVPGSHADAGQANMEGDKLGKKISFSTTPLLLEAHNATTNSLLKNEVEESQDMLISSDVLPMPSFLQISSDDMANFLSSRDSGSRHEVSSFCCSRSQKEKDKYLNFTHPLHNIDGACHSFPPYFPRKIKKQECLLCPTKITDTIQQYQYNDFTIPREIQEGSSVLGRSSVRFANESNWIPLSSSHGCNQPGSVSSEDVIRTLAHGMALGGFNYIAPLARSQKHHCNHGFPYHSIRSVSSGTGPLWFQENNSPRLDESEDRYVSGDLEQHASCMDVISHHDTAVPGSCGRQKVDPSLANTKSFSFLNNTTTLFYPTRSHDPSCSLWDPPTRAPMPSGSNVKTPVVSNQESFLFVALPQEYDERGVMATMDPNNASDASHYALDDTSQQLSVPFPHRLQRNVAREEVDEKIKRASSEEGVSLFHENSTSKLFSPLRGMVSFVDHSPTLTPHTDTRVAKERNDLKSKPVAVSKPIYKQQCWVPHGSALHDSSPLALGQWQGSVTRGRSSQETSFLMRANTSLSSGESTISSYGYRNPPQSPNAPSLSFLTMTSELHFEPNAEGGEDPLMCVRNSEKRYSEPFSRRSSTSPGVDSQSAQVTSAVLQQIPLRGQRSSMCTLGFVVVPSQQQICNPIQRNDSILNEPSSPLRRFKHNSSTPSSLVSDTSRSSCRAVVMGSVFGSSFTTSLTHFPLHSSPMENGQKTSESHLPLAAATWAGISNLPTAASRYNHSDTSSMATLCRRERALCENLFFNGKSCALKSEAISMHPPRSPNGINMHNLGCPVVSPIDMEMGYGKLFARSPLKSNGRTLTGHRKSIELEATLLGQPIEPLPIMFPEILSLNHQSVSSTIGSQEGWMERILRNSGIVMSVASAATATAASQPKKTTTPHASPLHCSISCGPIRQEVHTTSSHTTHSTEAVSSRSGKGAQSCRTIGESKSNTIRNFFTTRQDAVKVPSFVSPVDVEALLDASEERMRKSRTQIVQLSYLNDGIKTFPKSFIIGMESSGVETSESSISTTSCPSSSLDAQKKALRTDSSYLKDTKKQSDEIHDKNDSCNSMSISQKNYIDITLASFESK